MGRTILGAFLSLLGASIGAFLGVLIFGWVLKQGFYALVIPGAALGLGCHLASPNRSKLRGLFCGVLAVVVGYYAEWRYRPWEEPDDNLGYFLTHLADLKPPSLTSWSRLVS